MSIRTTWSGGATWSGTAKWMPDGSPTGPFPMVHVAIGGTLIEGLQSASWGFGPRDWLDGLSPGSGTFTFAGSPAVEPRQQVVVTCPAGNLWNGYVDTVTADRGADGNTYTTVAATDILARLGTVSSNPLVFYTPTDGTTIVEMAIAGSLVAGVAIEAADGSSGLPDLDYTASGAYSGSIVDFINRGLKSSNGMAAPQRDGSVLVLMREALPGAGLNGTFEVDTTGWAGDNGGSIARSTTDPYAGVASARITSGTTNLGGAGAALSGTFKAGRSYTATVAMQLISGTAGWYIDMYDSTSGEDHFTVHTVTASWAEYTYTWTPDEDCTDLGIYIIHQGTTDSVLAIDSVTVRPTSVDVSDRLGLWTTTTTVDTDVNVWYDSGGTTIGDDIADQADYLARGATVYQEDADLVRTLGAATDTIYDDWIAYGGNLRPLATGELVAASWDDADILALEPFGWLTVDGTDWQVYSLRHTVTISPPSWRVSVTADTFLSLL